MTTAPRFTVVIPTRNRADLLPRAVASALGQSLQDLELIVVDDGSTDDTGLLQGRLGDPRLRWIHQPHRGVSAARNRGAAEAAAPWLTFLDSDDEALPGWLERFAAAALNRSSGGERPAGLVSAGCLRRNGTDGEEIAVAQEARPEMGGQPLLTLAGTFAVRRDLFRDAGGYDEELRFSENSELLIRLVRLAEERELAISTLTEPAIIYHRAAAAHRHRPEASRDRLAAVEHVVAKHGRRLARVAPGTLADYHAVAGVSAARLGEGGRARHHLFRALAADPLRPRHLGRLLVSLAPPLMRRLWKVRSTRADARPGRAA